MKIRSRRFNLGVSPLFVRVLMFSLCFVSVDALNHVENLIKLDSYRCFYVENFTSFHGFTSVGGRVDREMLHVVHFISPR